MVDLLIVESIKISVGKMIIFWDNFGRRFEGKILDCSDDFLRYYDTHKDCERFIRLDEIKECELK